MFDTCSLLGVLSLMGCGCCCGGCCCCCCTTTLCGFCEAALTCTGTDVGEWSLGDVVAFCVLGSPLAICICPLVSACCCAGFPPPPPPPPPPLSPVGPTAT